MTKPTMTYKPFDVVVVPFPFTDKQTPKRRPALVLSSQKFNEEINHCVLAMITSAKHSTWPLDTPITALKSSGLLNDSIIRMKLFTLDNQLIIRKAGHLSKKDREAARRNLAGLLA